jgi:hypothetical protein
MATRPCKPGADVKRIWQLLLPDTPFPACGTQQNTEAAKQTPSQSEPPTQAPRDDAPARRDGRRPAGHFACKK